MTLFQPQAAWLRERAFMVTRAGCSGALDILHDSSLVQMHLYAIPLTLIIRSIDIYI